MDSIRFFIAILRTAISGKKVHTFTSLVKTNLIYEKHIHHLMVYFCVIWNLVDCRNNKAYNTQVITEIKGQNEII